MFTSLLAKKLLILTLATVCATLFNLGIVIFEDPPDFFCYIFGFITGANWVALLALFVIYYEDRQDEKIDSLSSIKSPS